MDQHQIQLLTRMKGLIKEGKRKFKVRKDRNYLDDLLDLSLTVDEAWEEILTLNKNSITLIQNLFIINHNIV